MEEVLQQHCNHGVGSHPAVEGRQAHPKAKHSLVLHTLRETVNEPFVGELSSSVYITTIVLFFMRRIFVLTLSKGSTQIATAMPEIADAVSRIDIVSLVSLFVCISISFD